MEEYDADIILKTIFDSKDSNRWKPSDKIPVVIKEIEQLKNDMKEFLNTSNHDIVSILEGSRELCVESKELVDEMQMCKKEIEQETMADILKSLEHHNALAKELKRVHFSLELVYEVVQCGKYVKEFDDGREAQSFTRAVEAVYDLLQYIDTPVEGFKEMDMYTNTKHTAQLILDSLLHDLYEEWSRLVATTSRLAPRKTVVTITLNLEDTLIVIDVLRALDRSKKLEEKVSEFAQFLLKSVLIPIIHNDCTVYAETNELVTITINQKRNFVPPYDAVISNLRLLFHFLSNKLNLEYNRDCTLMRLIGKEICVPFRDILVKDCLINTIPNNINELQTYGRITSEIQDFQYFLTVVKFFPDEKFTVLQYVDNIDMLFANKSSQHFLETARAIMIKDLSRTMSIGVESIPETDAGPDFPLDATTESALEVLSQTIPKSLFYFPRCMISKTAQELLDLVYVMMEQAVQCSDIVCKKLYTTTRLVFELYDAVVPYHHENFLLSIPQYVGKLIHTTRNIINGIVSL